MLVCNLIMLGQVWEEQARK